MKRLFILIFCSWIINSLAQPTSIAGITPGKTTLEELRNLVQPDGLATKKIVEGYNYVKINSMDKKSASVKVLSGVVYEINISLYEDVIINTLYEKYGRPIEISGSIDKVICKNKFGGEFERVQGVRRELWGQKDGVQALIEWIARECAEMANPYYKIYHVETIEAIKRKDREKKENILKEQTNKVKDLL